MKKNYIITVMLLFISVITQAQLKSNDLDISNSEILNEKGKNYIREGLLNELLEQRNGATGSAQHIESFYGEGSLDSQNDFLGFKSNTKGIIIGTTSLLKRNEDTPEKRYITGVSLGYLDSEIKYRNSNHKDKMKTIGGNIYFARLKNNNIAFTYFGYSHSTAKDGVGRQDRNNLNIGAEIGRAYVFNKNSFIYPYISIEYNGSFREKDSKENYYYEEGIVNIGRGNIGFYYVYDKNKFRVSLHTKYANEIVDGITNQNIYSWDNSEYLGRQKKDNDYILSSLSLGYYLSRDMLLSIETTGRYSKESEDIIYGLKIEHRF